MQLYEGADNHCHNIKESIPMIGLGTACHKSPKITNKAVISKSFPIFAFLLEGGG